MTTTYDEAVRLCRAANKAIRGTIYGIHHRWIVVEITKDDENNNEDK